MAEVTHNAPRTYYFEAERQKLTPPARRYYDGYCNDFQCVRINAESPQEQARPGVIALDISRVAPGYYQVWALVKGKGAWTSLGTPAPVDTDKWRWVRLAPTIRNGTGDHLDISSADDLLMLDTVILTTEDFVPTGPDPRDAAPPSAVTGLAASVDREKKYVTLTWDRNADGDLHHYSVYCGVDESFACGNATLIRSVYKTSITDAGMATGGPVYYKVVAYDSRENASKPTAVKVEVE